MSLKVYFLETRPQFLVLSIVVTFLGTAMACYQGSFHLGHTLLVALGLLLLHVSVNTLNDYVDYKTGVDMAANRTPFSGGSGLLTSGQISARATLWMGVVAFVLAGPIGLYFLLVRGWFLLPLFLIGSVFVLAYSGFLNRIGLVGIAEASAGLGLGTLPVWGIYAILHPADPGYSLWALFASVPSGILVCNLLLLNEFPDVEADRVGGRRTLPMLIGKDRAAILYTILTTAVYVWIMLGVVLGITPLFTLLGLLTLPMAIKAIQGSFAHGDRGRLLAAQGANVMVVLLTQALLGIGYLLATVF